MSDWLAVLSWLRMSWNSTDLRTWRIGRSQNISRLLKNIPLLSLEKYGKLNYEKMPKMTSSLIFKILEIKIWFDILPSAVKEYCSWVYLFLTIIRWIIIVKCKLGVSQSEVWEIRHSFRKNKLSSFADLPENLRGIDVSQLVDFYSCGPRFSKLARKFLFM